ncbi:MAG TPA: acyl-CoA dehydrogenase family protein [Acidimicrobiales bacterium]
MNFELSEEQEAFRKVVRDFAEGEIAPHAEEWDRTHHFPVDTVLAMGELGLFGLPFPPEYGGSGADFTTFCLAVEELGRVDSSMAITLSAGVGLGANPIFAFGTDEQRGRWLPPLCAGEALAAFGLTEPDAGSDAGATRTRGRFDSARGEWVIDGAKAFITNSGTPITSLITVTARTEAAAEAAGPAGRPEAAARRSISAIVVPTGTPGLVVEPPYRKMGWHASDTHGLVLDGCRVPADHLLGGQGQGLAQFLSILDGGRIAIAALAVGLAQACLEQSLAHARSRESFGGPIGRHQAIAFKIADMAVAVECARTLTYKAAWLKDHGRPVKEVAAMAKLYATEAAVAATREATQIFGGAGFLDESPVARYYRDAKILEIGEGTSEVQRLVIGRSLGLPVA